MIAGIGIDLVELDRLATILQKQERFSERILTPKEHEHFLKLSNHRQIEFLAGRFAAKEAFGKAIGTGIGSDFSFQDLEVMPNEKNKPIAVSTLFSGKIHLSISHSKEYAIAQVVLEENK